MAVTLLTADGLCTFINQHFPPENAPLTLKDEHQENLHHLLAPLPKSSTIILMGDTNTRWHGRRPGEEDILGTHIFGCGIEYLERHSHVNRDYAVDLLRSHSLTNLSLIHI